MLPKFTHMVPCITWLSLVCNANARVLASEVIEVDGRWLAYKPPCMLSVKNEKCTDENHNLAKGRDRSDFAVCPVLLLSALL